MSKRFGRQQKRKLLAQLAMFKRLNEFYSDQNIQIRDALVNWEDQVEFLFGPDSSLSLNVTEYDRYPDNHYRSVHVAKPAPTFPPAADPVTMSARLNRVYQFTSLIEKLPDEASLMVRFIEKDNQTGESRYVVTEDEVRRFGLDNSAIKHLASSIAEKLVSYVNNNRRRL